MLMKLPHRIYIARHGESVANIDPNTYYNIPDHRIQLTDIGDKQADELGELLHNHARSSSLDCYISTYSRAVETFDKVKRHINTGYIKYTPLLREQEWRSVRDIYFNTPEQDTKDINFQDLMYYRRSGGESPADTYNRSETFLNSLFRDFNTVNHSNSNDVLIISHGVIIRTVLMSLLNWSERTYLDTPNPKNCELFVLEYDESVSKNHGGYKLL